MESDVWPTNDKEERRSSRPPFVDVQPDGMQDGPVPKELHEDDEQVTKRREAEKVIAEKAIKAAYEQIPYYGD